MINLTDKQLQAKFKKAKLGTNSKNWLIAYRHETKLAKIKNEMARRIVAELKR